MLITIMKLVRLDTGSLALNGFRALRTAGTALWRWRRQRLVAAELHGLSDHSLKDIGIARSRIEEEVRLSKRHVRPANSTGLT